MQQSILTTLLFTAALLSAPVYYVSAAPVILPQDAQDCGNGIFCTTSQTCMSNATGAGTVYACSPISNAVRCSDARFSCPPMFYCAENAECVSTDDKGGAVVDAMVNLDAFSVADARDFGSGMQPTSVSVCGPVTSIFRLPNFCTCRNVPFGGELACTIGVQTYVTIGASVNVMPCASPASFGYRVWASLLGASRGIGDTWHASFAIHRPIPGASFEIGRSNAGARVELSGEVNRFVLSTRLAIGVCAQLRAGPFSAGYCNPSFLRWLPITIINGPRYDFSRFCQ